MFAPSQYILGPRRALDGGPRGGRADVPSRGRPAGAPAVVPQAGSANPGLSASLGLAIGCLAYCLWLSPVVFGFVAITVLFGVTTYRLMARGARTRFRHARDSQDGLMQHYRTLIHGAKE